MTVLGRARLRAVLLVAPLIIFLAVFFAWPLVSVLTASVRNEGIIAALPKTGQAIAGWDGTSLPDSTVQTAMIDDLRGIDRQTLGSAVGRLNSAVPGFRSLISATASAANDIAPGTVADLIKIDERWADLRFWRAIQSGSRLYTDRNLLAAIDLQRSDDGTIGTIPAGRSANRTILTRTFFLSAIITLSCLAIGLPYAMVAASFGGWQRQE